MKQTDAQKLERSADILNELKEARGGTLLDSHRVMGNDPNLINMFLQQYVNCNKKDISIPKKYRELIVMAIGMATGTETTMKVHAKIAMENGAVFEVIMGDVKANEHTDETNRHRNGNVLEFIVDGDRISEEVWYHGDVSYAASFLSGQIESITKLFV